MLIVIAIIVVIWVILVILSIVIMVHNDYAVLRLCRDSPSKLWVPLHGDVINHRAGTTFLAAYLSGICLHQGSR